MARMRGTIVVAGVHHVMLHRLGGLLIVLADRHAGRGDALQRQPQHDEDQNELTQKKRHFFLSALQGYVLKIKASDLKKSSKAYSGYDPGSPKVNSFAYATPAFQRM